MAEGDRRRSVLLIERDEQICATMEWILAERGYHVRVARTCAEALLRGRGRKPDLVLGDILAAGPAGVDAMVSLAGELDARLLFLSGDADQGLARRALRRQGVWLLPKPFTRDALIRTLSAVLDS